MKWRKKFPWPVSICPHDSLDIVDPHAQYARFSNLRLLKYVQDSVTCVSKWKFSQKAILENLSDKPVHVDVPASNEFKVLGLGKVHKQIECVNPMKCFEFVYFQKF